ncbi:DUF885 domain-containing protein [Rhizorhabdus phycosphaerae]|uniref:DUF885 domain-containing protein n=1 Tax=Rhizorhabdus phycosphaerae TaxID=2711156 RepID=UPI0013ED55FF|nr:DUF885 domain-containing protein [Rhizorhabdus phycosphaerae]
MLRTRLLLGCCAMLSATIHAPASTAATPSMPAAQSEVPAALIALAEGWRRFAQPEFASGAPDYGPEALARKRAGLVEWKIRLQRLDRTGWTQRAQADAQLLEAEMNGLDFDLRVRRPWARDPSYFATVFGEESDVPAHEGPSADVIDLFRYEWPLSKADDARLTVQMRSVPLLLQRARIWLADGNAADLWRYGDRALGEQAAVLSALLDGSLSMRTLEGQKAASLKGSSPALRRAVTEARDATLAFAAWVKAQAPSKTGPSGVGKADYDWYMKHVQLLPYDWEAQRQMLQRELDRAWAGLRLEEARNRNLPPLAAIDDPAAYRQFAERKMARFTDFLVANRLMADKPYYRAALAAQTLNYVPPERRNFFYHVTALDPWPLYSHDIHWMELARIKHEPNEDPIRRTAPLFNIFQSRSEGFATALEEIAMHAGLYDEEPRGRELVWIMLANRAARGLASLHVQANEWTLAEAGRFHARWTPRGYSDPDNPLVGFEQLLYLRQPGYGTSYITGKLELDALIADAAAADEKRPAADIVADVFGTLNREGAVPFALYPRRTR